VEAPVLRECLTHPYLRGKPLLVFLNAHHRSQQQQQEEEKDEGEGEGGAGPQPYQQQQALLTPEILRVEVEQLLAAESPHHTVPLHVEACVARAAANGDGAASIDPRIEAGVAWLVGAVAAGGARLLERVAADTAAAREALAMARVQRDRELLRAALDKAADGVGKQGGGEEGVFSEEEVRGMGDGWHRGGGGSLCRYTWLTCN
jgi:hypothetical protein